MGVSLRHAGDDPDEIWFECPECEGTGKINIPDPESVLAGGDPEAVSVEATCPDCDGLGFYEGAPDDDIDETRWTDA